MALFPSNPLLYSSTFPCSFTPKTSITPILRRTNPISATTPARDRIIDFGKHRGKMLGTLPSRYLEWVSNNLRARDFEDWAKLADEVLQDPVYKDRLEWEFAERVLHGDVSSSRSESPVANLVEISERFGWDYDDKVGWSRVNFELLGTSNGGRIPRVCGGEEREVRLKRERVRVCEGGERRRERRERVRSKKLGIAAAADDGGVGGDEMRFQRDEESHQDRTVEIYNPFPGREALLKKVLNRKRLL